MDDSRRCTATSKQSGERCKRAASRGRTVCAMHGGKSLRGADHPNFKTGRYSKALPHRLLRNYEKLRDDTALISMRDEVALLDLKLLERVEAEDWPEVERLIEIRRKLVATEARVEALRATTLSEKEAMALVSGLIAALKKHIDDPQIIEDIGRDVELLLGG